MHDQARIATLTLRDPAAVMARQCRCVASTVEKHQRLPATLQTVLEPLQEWRGQAMLQTPLAYIQNLEAGVHRTAGALRQMERLITLLLYIVETLQCRGRGTQQHRHPAPLGAQQRQIAGVITEALLLFVDRSCSSSMMIRPSAASGVNSAERVPITTGA